jgi:putative chitinase
MRAREFLQELFNRPYPVKVFKDQAIARDSKGREIFIEFTRTPSWETAKVTFARGESGFDLTGAGDEMRVFATVVAAIREWAAQHEPGMIYFSVENSDLNRRAQLYQRMIRALVPGTNYQQVTRQDASQINDEAVSYWVEKLGTRFPEDTFFFLVRRDLLDADVGEGIAPVGPALPMPSQYPRRTPQWPSPEERRKKKVSEASDADVERLSQQWIEGYGSEDLAYNALIAIKEEIVFVLPRYCETYRVACDMRDQMQAIGTQRFHAWIVATFTQDLASAGWPQPHSDAFTDLTKQLVFKPLRDGINPLEQDLEEGWRDWVGGAALGAAVAAGGAAGYDAVKNRAATDQPAATQAQQQPTLSRTPQAVPKKSVTGSPHENVLTRAAVAAGIKGTELAQFLAQTAHETGDFLHMIEVGSAKHFKKYEPKFIKDAKTGKYVNVNPRARTLGNVRPGDGELYKGRGYIQLTGRYNYQQAGEALGLPLEQNPRLLERPDVAAQVAVWYWQNRVAPRVSDFADTRAVTRPINPGLRGLEDRHDRFNLFRTSMT